MQEIRQNRRGPLLWLAARSPRFWAVVVGVPTAALSIAVALGVWCLCAPAIPHSKMKQMHSGMSTAEVTSLLGAPGGRDPGSDGSQTWRYTRMTWAIFTVDFGPDGKVVGFDHDF